MKQWRLHLGRAQEDELLKVAIKAAQKRTRESYGARRPQPELAADGFVAGRDRIARLRRELGLRWRQKRKFKATTNSNHSLPERVASHHKRRWSKARFVIVVEKVPGGIRYGSRKTNNRELPFKFRECSDDIKTGE